MSDYMAAEIWIGGTISPSLVANLCAAITKQCASLEWGDAHFSPGTQPDLLEASQEKDGVSLLWLCDDQARWGEFDALERFLWENGITYTRRSDGKYEYDPEVVEFRPEQGMISLLTNNAGEPVVPVSELADIDAALTQVLELPDTASKQTISSAVQSAQRLLRERLPAVVPPLEPFEIEEGTNCCLRNENWRPCWRHSGSGNGTARVSPTVAGAV